MNCGAGSREDVCVQSSCRHGKFVLKSWFQWRINVWVLGVNIRMCRSESSEVKAGQISRDIKEARGVLHIRLWSHVWWSCRFPNELWLAREWFETLSSRLNSALTLSVPLPPSLLFFSPVAPQRGDTFRPEFGCSHQNGVGVHEFLHVCLILWEKIIPNFIKPNVHACRLNTDNSQLIINALLTLPKCQVTQIVGGLFSFKYTHPHTHNQKKKPLRQRPDASSGTERTLHKSNIKKQPN